MAPREAGRKEAPSGDEEIGVGEGDVPATPTTAAPAQVPDSAIFPDDWCRRVGSDIADQTILYFSIADDYALAQEADCATSGLTSELSDALYPGWINYL